jgi:hypothetical protein
MMEWILRGGAMANSEFRIEILCLHFSESWNTSYRITESLIFLL